jgi:hypothetical protein
MQKPWMPEEEMVENIDGKAMTMGFVLNSDDHWVLDLRFGDSAFYAAMSLRDLGRFSQVLGEYFEKGRVK